MKWKISSEVAREGETSHQKSMSYAINDEHHIPNTKKSPVKIKETAIIQKYKPRSSNEHTDSYHNYGLSLEETYQNTTDFEKDGNNGNIFTISSNQTKESVPWLRSTVVDKTITNITGAPINDNNLNSMILVDNYADESNNDFHYANTNTNTNPSSHGSLKKNGSTTKLLPIHDDSASTQSKCSIFRGLVLCLCLNITYTNIVRFPRELEKYGSAFIIPYMTILLLVGLPIILLEVSVGQFLGQGAANTWRASPILKGATIVGRFASWLIGLWISLQAALAVVYVGMLIFKTVPFTECGVVKMEETGYKKYGKNGQECIQKTFLVPVWEDALAFALLTFAVIFIWMIVMGCTHSAKVFRRSTFILGLLGFALLISLAVWEVYKSLDQKYFPQIWPFNESSLTNSNLWFNALVQVIYSTNIGLGVIPVITGKYLYKGDAVRTSVVYLCFNLLINAISVTLFMVQYDNIFTKNSTNPVEELKPLTAIYDFALTEKHYIHNRLIPGLIYALIVISAIVTISSAIFTSSRIVPRHPNYILSLIALFVSIGSLVVPKYIVARVLDIRLVPTLVITSHVFDLIGTTWIYGAKNIYTDLEFSVGRSILKSWLLLWCLIPIILTGLLVWWCVDDNQYDVLSIYIPRWAPIVFVLAIILVIACVEIFKQVDYNFFGMICEAAKPAKEWGPADPLARHAWKQWRSVCQDTGQKDFTLRRRGTRDYTHSIKRGQYSAAKYGTQNWKSSTPGNSSPNCSGSVFGDSAIEEDMSVDKYSGINQQFAVYPGDNIVKHIRYSGRKRKTSYEKRPNSVPENHKEIVYVRRSSIEGNPTKIEISPISDLATYSARNPLAKSPENLHSNMYYAQKDKAQLKSNNLDHICWKKFSVNSEEYSTEL